MECEQSLLEFAVVSVFVGTRWSAPILLLISFSEPWTLSRTANDNHADGLGGSRKVDTPAIHAAPTSSPTIASKKTDCRHLELADEIDAKVIRQ
ncbi:MAG: hypothetical protein JWP89_5155 [Schlesneria sp.]|nr:hypothetical protein [Schlesneria sp.]